MSSALPGQDTSVPAVGPVVQIAWLAAANYLL